MNETVMKPMSVARQEFIEKLVHDINTCQLPMFVVEPILQEMLNMVNKAARKQYEVDLVQYEELLKQQQTSDE